MNVRIAKKNVMNADCALLRLISITWAAPTNVNHGTKDAFSTGSQAQKPPKLKASYAHAPPIKTPVPKTITPKNAHGSAGLIHSLNFFFHNPAMAYAKGTTVNAKPKNKVGG